jgi:hypothetical protein
MRSKFGKSGETIHDNSAARVSRSLSLGVVGARCRAGAAS